MEALEMLLNRRSIRKFKSEQVTREELDKVLEAGKYAPTAAGKQQPVIVAVQDPDTVAKIDHMNAAVMGREGLHPYYGAPTILLVLSPEDGFAPVEDACLIAGNMLNAAYALGLGTCYIHRSKQMFESDEGRELMKEWGIEGNFRGVCSIALGYPDCEHPEPAPRKEDYVKYIG